MHPDSDNLTTVQAFLEQDGAQVTVSLLKPFTPPVNLDQSKISHLKLLSGNESGVSLSVDGSQLIIDLDAYREIIASDSEQLNYKYRINDPLGAYSQHTAMLTISQSEEGAPGLSEANLTTDKPFDESLYEAIDQEQEPDIAEDVELTVEAPVEESNADDFAEQEALVDLSAQEELAVEFDENLDDVLPTEPDGIVALSDNPENFDEIEVSDNNQSDSPDEPVAEVIQNEDIKSSFSFDTQIEDTPADDELDAGVEATSSEKVFETIAYEDLTPEDPEPEAEKSDPEEVDFDKIAREVDEAIAQADRLMDSAFSVQSEDELADVNESSTIIEPEPEPEPEQPLDIESSSEADLTHLIERIPPEENVEQVESNLVDEEPVNNATSELEDLIQRLPDMEPEDESTLDEVMLSTTIEAEEELSQSGAEIVIGDNEAYIFDLDDFEVSNGAQIEHLDSIRLENLPTTGVMLYNKEPAIEGQDISRTALLTGRLSYRASGAGIRKTWFGYSSCVEGNYNPPVQLILRTDEKSSTQESAITHSDAEQRIDIEVSAYTDELLVASGNISIVLSGSDKVGITPGTFEGNYGFLTINSSGYWTYSADIKQQALVELQDNDYLAEHLVISTEDDRQHDITFNIIGPGVSPSVELAS